MQVETLLGKVVTENVDLKTRVEKLSLELEVYQASAKAQGRSHVLPGGLREGETEGG